MAQYTIPCIMVDQRKNGKAPKFALLAAPAGEIAKWAGVKRRTETKQGAQRALNQAKLSALSRFLQKHDENTVPPAITITLRVDQAQIQVIDKALSFHLITLNVADDIADNEKPGMIIDGQHRLFGMMAYSPECLVNVVALINANDLETAFQFLVINNKVTPVQPDLIRTLALDYEAADLAERLKSARLALSPNLAFVGIMDSDDDSPFRGFLSLVSADGQQEQRFVSPAAIENAIGTIQKEDVPELKSEDALCEFFYAIWSCLKEDRWADLWNRDSKLMTKAGIVAMTSFFTKALIAKYDYAGDLDVSNPQEVSKEVRSILKYQTPDFWKCEWTMKISDAIAVREKITDSLTKIHRNMRAEVAWYEDVDLVSL